MRSRLLWAIFAALAACQRGTQPDVATPPASAPAAATPPAAPADLTNRIALAAPDPAVTTSTAPPATPPPASPAAPAGAAGSDEPAPEGCAKDFGARDDAVTRIAALTRCEAAARGARGPEAGPLLVAFGRLCERFPYFGAWEFMEQRPDLFRQVEIHGWTCRADVFSEVVRRFPGSVAADDAAWELARWIGGECESFVDCELDNALKPLERYRKTWPRGRHLGDGVALAVESLTRNLAAFDPKAPLGNSEPVASIVARYEDAARGLPAPLRARLLGVVAGWWEKLGDAPRAQRARAEAERSGPE